MVDSQIAAPAFHVKENIAAVYGFASLTAIFLDFIDLLLVAN